MNCVMSRAQKPARTPDGSSRFDRSDPPPPRLAGVERADVVEGLPDEYLEMNGSYDMKPEQRVA
jgi:hypothetical protein